MTVRHREPQRPARRGGETGAGRSGGPPFALGGALRRAWVGYQQRLDKEMAAAGFTDRRFPDGRVLRLCARSEEVTPSRIGRELGITRQGAGKIVAGLRDRGYVTLDASSNDGREKVVSLTPRARHYLTAQRAAARRIEHELREQVGTEAFESLALLLDLLGVDQGQSRMRDYLRRASHLADAEPSLIQPPSDDARTP